jgi:hypothetical protein
VCWPWGADMCTGAVLPGRIGAGPFRCQQEAASSPWSRPQLGRVDGGAAHVLGRVGGDAPIDVGETVDRARGRQAPVDGRGRQALILHGAPVQLQVGAGGRRHSQIVIGGPLEQGTQIVAVRLRVRPR